MKALKDYMYNDEHFKFLNKAITRSIPRIVFNYSMYDAFIENKIV